MSLLKNLEKILAMDEICKENIKRLKNHLKEDLMRGDDEEFFVELDLLKKI
jgi:hypothetical protein